MDQENEIAQDQAEPAKEPLVDPAELEMPLKFELGQKRLTLAELESLAPGVTFPLEADPLGPVAVTCHQQTVARGRLVDLGGSLGVQITRVYSGHPHPHV